MIRKHIVSIIIILVIGGIVIYILSKKKPQDSQPEQAKLNKDEIKRKIKDYLARYYTYRNAKEKEDYRFIYGLINMRPKEFQHVEYRGNLNSFGFNRQETLVARDCLRELVYEVLKNEGINAKAKEGITESDLMMFLTDYYEKKAKLDALLTVKRELEEKGEEFSGEKIKKCNIELEKVRRNLQDHLWSICSPQ